MEEVVDTLFVIIMQNLKKVANVLKPLEVFPIDQVLYSNPAVFAIAVILSIAYLKDYYGRL